MSRRKLFRRGTVTCALNEEERLWILSLIKLAPKTKDPYQQRLALRCTRRMMGMTVHNYPLHEPKECPICERTVAFKAYNRHVFACREKQRELKRLPPIDPEVYEMLGGTV